MFWFSHPFLFRLFSSIFVPKHPTGSLARIVVFYHHPSNWATGPVDSCRWTLWFKNLEICCNTTHGNPWNPGLLLYEKEIHWKIGERSPKWRSDKLNIRLNGSPFNANYSSSKLLLFHQFAAKNKTHLITHPAKKCLHIWNFSYLRNLPVTTSRPAVLRTAWCNECDSEDGSLQENVPDLQPAIPKRKEHFCR